jgi:predicted porin
MEFRGLVTTIRPVGDWWRWIAPVSFRFQWSVQEISQMKKSVVALAVLGAFTGLASAQSSVTLYGRVDANVGSVDPGSLGKAGRNAKVGESVAGMSDGGTGGLGASRFGMRGTEDLGDGLKAYFKLESQIAVDTGANGGATQTSTNAMFNREAYVALGSTTWGDIRFGRLETLSREVNRTINDASDDNQLTLSEVIGTNRNQTGYNQNLVYFNNFGTRVDNAISYRSPSFMGIAQMIATYSFGEKASAPAGNATAAFTGDTAVAGNIASYTGVGFIVTAGPLSADMIYEQLNGNGTSGAASKTGTIGANYDLGFAKIYAAYQDGADVTQAFGANAMTTFNSGTGSTVGSKSGVDLKASNFGVKVPVGKWTFVAQYTQSELSGNNLANSVWGEDEISQAKYGMSAAYALSKRTTIYGVVIGRSGDQDEYFNRKNEYNIGLAHTF